MRLVLDIADELGDTLRRLAEQDRRKPRDKATLLLEDFLAQEQKRLAAADLNAEVAA